MEPLRRCSDVSQPAAARYPAAFSGQLAAGLPGPRPPLTGPFRCLPRAQVGSIVNFALMWLLAPTASAAGGGAASINFFQRLFTEHNLVAMGAPGGHMFQPGYSLGARLINFAYKGCVFAFIGMCSGLIGTALSNSLVALRKKMDPTYTSPVSGSREGQGCRAGVRRCDDGALCMRRACRDGLGAHSAGRQ